jgi:hypothetical protein
MKIILLVTIYIFLITLSATAQIKPIDKEEFTSIGGIEQWVTIKGADTNKPVILFLHGGPGSVMSPFETFCAEWKKEFILVNWECACERE